MTSVGTIDAEVRFTVHGVEEVRRLVVKPGDVLLVQVAHTSGDVVDHIRRVLRNTLPDVPVLIHNGSIDMSVLAVQDPDAFAKAVAFEMQRGL